MRSIFALFFLLASPSVANGAAIYYECDLTTQLKSGDETQVLGFDHKDIIFEWGTVSRIDWELNAERATATFGLNVGFLPAITIKDSVLKLTTFTNEWTSRFEYETDAGTIEVLFECGADA